MHDRLGVVVIGRNEGERLRRCFESLGLKVSDNQAHVTNGHPARVVYVDSGSTDGSVRVALSFGANVVELDLATPFTAARARNEGLARLCELESEICYVQFLDGDCAIVPSWICNAASLLDEQENVAVVCGGLTEQNRQRTIYNRLCYLEWQKIPGEILAAGGIFMIRANAFMEVGGFDPSVVAAEDDELCLRLRRRGWKIKFIDQKMAVHDAAMTRFSQWWKRAERAGYAYAQGAFLHGRSDGHFVKQVRGIIAWGIVLPLVVLVLAWPTNGWSTLLLVAYLYLILRVYRHGRVRGWTPSDSRLYAYFVILAKFPAVIGLMRFIWRQLMGKSQTIIEHKPPLPKPHLNSIAPK